MNGGIEQFINGGGRADDLAGALKSTWATLLLWVVVIALVICMIWCMPVAEGAIASGGATTAGGQASLSGSTLVDTTLYGGGSMSVGDFAESGYCKPYFDMQHSLGDATGADVQQWQLDGLKSAEGMTAKDALAQARAKAQLGRQNMKVNWEGAVASGYDGSKIATKGLTTRVDSDHATGGLGDKLLNQNLGISDTDAL